MGAIKSVEEIDMEILSPLSTVTDDIKKMARLEHITRWRLYDRHRQTIME